MNAKIFFRGGKEFNIELSYEDNTYRPIRLQYLTSPLGSGMVTVLLDRIDPEILKAFLAMIGSLIVDDVHG